MEYRRLLLFSSRLIVAPICEEQHNCAALFPYLSTDTKNAAISDCMIYIGDKPCYAYFFQIIHSFP